ncbi:MAG TPA: DUF2917 domain-containing protein [Burkholderiales bacterium]
MNRNSVVIELAAQSLVSLQDGEGTRVYCLQGSLWITEERSRQDIVIGSGGSYRLAGGGRAIVQAMGASRVAVEAPSGRPQIALPTPLPVAA